jgi:NADH-quinone oxidoreductase subunit J
MIFPLAQSLAFPTVSAGGAILLSTLLFYGFAALTAGGAIGVVASRNIVRAAVCLLAALVGVAGVYFLLDAEFLAAVQLVVYVGGTLILIVFGVMLTSSSPFARFGPSRSEAIVAITIAAVLGVCLVISILVLPPTAAIPPTADSGYPMTQLGEALMGDYLVPFELASVILLVVMIGAAYLAKGRRHAPSGDAHREVPR